MLPQFSFEIFETGLEICRRVISVMQMDLHFPITLPAKLGKVIEKFGAVFLSGKEKRMLGGPAIRVPESVRELRVVRTPMLGPRSGDFQRRLGPERFVVVHETKEDMRWRNKFAPLARGEIAREPDLGILEHSDQNLDFGCCALKLSFLFHTNDPTEIRELPIVLRRAMRFLRPCRFLSASHAFVAANQQRDVAANEIIRHAQHLGENVTLFGKECASPGEYIKTQLKNSQLPINRLGEQKCVTEHNYEQEERRKPAQNFMRPKCKGNPPFPRQ